MCCSFLQLILFLVIHVVIVKTSDIKVASALFYPMVSCIDPIVLEENQTISLQATCLNENSICNYNPPINCTWHIYNNKSENYFIQIYSDAGCMNNNDTLLVTNCQNPANNNSTLISSQDIFEGVDLLTGENEICVYFVSTSNISECGHSNWNLKFSLISSLNVISSLNTYWFNNDVAISIFNPSPSANLIRIKNSNLEQRFEIWFTNSFSGASTDYKEPLYTAYASPNLTNLIGTFHKRDQKLCINSVNNELTLYYPNSTKSDFFVYNIYKATQTFYRNPTLAAQNCSNPDTFHFIYPTRQSFRINQSATQEGNCELHVVPALAKNIEHYSNTLPTLCITNIGFNHSKMLEAFTIYKESVNTLQLKLFECNQDSCKYWNDTCVNGDLLKFVVPSEGDLEFDLYSVGVLMSRNYPLLVSHQNTTQKVICNSCQATFNLTILDVNIPENFILTIHDENQLLYSFTKNITSNSTNNSIVFNSSQAIVEYLNNGNISLKSNGFLIHYEAKALNSSTTDEPIHGNHSSKNIVLWIVGGAFVLVIIILSVSYAYKCRRKCVKGVDALPVLTRTQSDVAEIQMNRMRVEFSTGLSFVGDGLSELGMNTTTTELQIDQLINKETVNQLKFPNILEEYTFNMDDIEDLGVFAATRIVVRKLKHKPTNIEMATKYITIPKSQIDTIIVNTTLDKIIREIENFKELSKCPQIVDLYGVCIHDFQALLCMELMDFSLHDYYLYMHRRVHEQVPEEVIGCIAAKIIDALTYCKSKCIAHRDIKPKNILIKRNGCIKLCDFGESRLVQNSLFSTKVGTIVYWPPEYFAIEGRKYDIRSDIWSLGITLMEVILGRIPYLGADADLEVVGMYNEFAIRSHILRANFSNIIHEISTRVYSSNLCTFLKVCTTKLKYRPKLDQLKEKAFYQTHRNKNSEEIEKFFANINI